MRFEADVVLKNLWRLAIGADDTLMGPVLESNVPSNIVLDCRVIAPASSALVKSR